MRTMSKNTHDNESRSEDVFDLQTPDEEHNDDVAELVKIATSLAMELDKVNKAPGER